MLTKNDQLQKYTSQAVEQMNTFLDNYKKLSNEDRLLLDKVKPFIDQILNKELVIKNNAYWIPNKDGSQSEGPFCIKCYSVDNKFIPMLDSITVHKCPVCDLAIKKIIEDLSIHELFILEHLVSQADRTDTFSELERAYNDKFRNTGPTLNIILNKLSKFNFIREIDIGGYDEIGYEVLPDGITYIGNLKDKKIRD